MMPLVHRPQVRLALPGAGVNGAKLVGFTKRVEQDVDFIASGGTSAGAIESAGVASGLTGVERARMWTGVLQHGERLKDGSPGRLFFGAISVARGRVLEKELYKAFEDRTLADLVIPFRAVAGDMCNSCAVVFCSHAHPLLRVVDVLMAAAAPQVLFPPRQVRGDNARVYADAGPSLNVPYGLWDDVEDGVPTLAVRLAGHAPVRNVQDLIRAASSTHTEADLERVRDLPGVVKATFNLFMDAAATALPSTKPDTLVAEIGGDHPSFDFNLGEGGVKERIAYGEAAGEAFVAKTFPPRRRR